MNQPLDVVAPITFLTTAFVITRLMLKNRRSFEEIQALKDQLRLVIVTIPGQVWSALPDARSLALITKCPILTGLGLMMISAGAFLTGLGLAPVFPNTLATFTRYYGKQASQLVGVVFVLASFGGALLPWLVGLVSSHYRDLRLGLLVPLLCGGVMLALQFAINRVCERRNTTP